MTSVAGAPALTSLSSGAGCGCKLAAADLLPIVRDLPAATDPRLLVGSATGDDAAVWRISDDVALVQTIDFFTPLVDDPYDFGRIAAANALSDVYAMGGRPITAMNVVAFPLEQLGGDVLAAILRGGHDVVASAGASLVGGHSIKDDEPKYGMAVTGTVRPDAIVSNAGGRPGDVLVLTKPLGVGAIVTAAKRGAAALASAFNQTMTSTAAASSASSASPRLRAVTIAPPPSGLVSTSASPARPPALVTIRKGWTAPVTASPYFGSGSSIEWPPTTSAPARRTTSSPPRSTAASGSGPSVSSGQATRFSAVSGRPPIA